MSSLVGELVLLASTAKTASFTGATTSAATLNRPTGSPTGNMGLQNGATFVLDCTTFSGTNSRLFAQVLGQYDAADDLFAIPGLVFDPNISAGVPEAITYNGALPPNLYVSATITGTTPSFTFSLKAYAIG